MPFNLDPNDPADPMFGIPPKRQGFVLEVPEYVIDLAGCPTWCQWHGDQLHPANDTADPADTFVIHSRTYPVLWPDVSHGHPAADVSIEVAEHVAPDTGHTMPAVLPSGDLDAPCIELAGLNRLTGACTRLTAADARALAAVLLTAADDLDHLDTLTARPDDAA